MRKKIIAVSVIMAFLAMLYAQSVVAQVTPSVSLYVWTDLRQYEPGATGTLYITVRNNLPDTDLIIKNITIIYRDWQAYVKDHWEGNESFTNIDAICRMKGGVYNREVTFTVPTDGRGETTLVDITVTTDKDNQFPWLLPLTDTISISVIEPPYPMAIEDIDLWMTSLIVAVVICTIILAIAVFLSTRKTPAPRFAAPPPPPPKPKAKAA